MIMELPKKFKAPCISCTGDVLIIHQLVRYEELVYSLTKAIRGKKCIYCGKKLKESTYTLDHRYPKNTGGVSITNNLFPCCDVCNAQKGNLTHKEYLKIMNLSKRDRKIVIKDIYEHNEIIMKKFGYKLPRKWVTFINVDDIIYTISQHYNKGKKYNDILKFYRENHKLPRPIIIDNNNFLLEGYNILLFAHEMNISEIPVIKLENVEVKR